MIEGIVPERSIRLSRSILGIQGNEVTEINSIGEETGGKTLDCLHIAVQKIHCAANTELQCICCTVSFANQSTVS